MPFKIPPYPETLTNANWQKNKGAIAKLAGETGIGDLMNKTKAAYDAIDWQKFELTRHVPLGKAATHDHVEAAYNDALKEGGKLKALDTAARKLETAAQELAAAWKKDKKIPAASAQHAQAVSDAAKLFNYATTMGTITDALKKERKENDDGIDVVQAGHKALNDKLRKYIDDFPDAAKKVTLEDYNDFWSEHIRGPGTVLPTLIKDHPELKGEWDVWKQFSNVLKTPGSEEDLKKQLLVLTTLAQRLKPKIAHI